MRGAYAARSAAATSLLHTALALLPVLFPEPRLPARGCSYTSILPREAEEITFEEAQKYFHHGGKTARHQWSPTRVPYIACTHRRDTRCRLLGHVEARGPAESGLITS